MGYAMRLITMMKFVGWLRGMTPSELCAEFPTKFTPIVYQGDTEKATQDLILRDAQIWHLIKSYWKFLMEKPNLGMFIPCDRDGNVLKEPIKKEYGTILAPYHDDMKEYKEAVDRIWFAKCSYEVPSRYRKIVEQNGTIAELVMYDYELTPSAIKRICR